MVSVKSEASGLSGAERAVILLMTLGEQLAAKVITHMSAGEVQKLGQTMAALEQVSQESVSKVLADFCNTVDQQTELGVNNRDYLHALLDNAFGEDKARYMLDRIQLGQQFKGLDALKWMEPRTVADLLRLEHPQAIAVILSYLEQDQAAEVLAALPDSMQVDLVMRIASLDGIPPGALDELNESVTQQLSENMTHIRSYTMGGLKTAANIMNFLDGKLEAELLMKIRTYDEDLGEGIQELKFEFTKLIELDDRAIQTMLREITSETLRIALRGADEAIKDKIFRNMSRRAGEMLRDDLETGGVLRLSEVKAARKKILTVIWDMVEIGEISLDAGDDKYV
jgi:flagellar motor switch protein FliG